jgi:hypothetical protein
MLFLNIFVSIESIDAASYPMLTSIYSLDYEVEQITHHSAIWWHRVPRGGELNRFYALYISLHLIHLLLDGWSLSEQFFYQRWSLSLFLGRWHRNLLFRFTLHE